MMDKTLTVNEIIRLYTDENIGTHTIAKTFKVGHKKISQILKENNITIKSKGGVKKSNIDITTQKTKLYKPTKDKQLVAKCKKTSVIINDPNNLSGKLTKHIIENYDNVDIPKNNYQRKKYEIDNGKKWFEEYFDVIEVGITPTRMCKLCNWETFDTTNKTGCFEQHINKNHNITILEYLKKFPEDYKYHPTIIKQNELNYGENFVVCQICNERMRSVTNTHLTEKHNITVNEYKLLYPNTKITSETTSKKLSDSTKILNQTLIPTWTSKGEGELKEFLESLGFEVVKGKNRMILDGKELDLLIPSLKIAFEYDGLYYHTEKMGKDSKYRLNKTLDCLSVGYKLYHVYEDEWVKNKELTKTKIKHILNKNDGIKIGARQVVIETISSEVKNEFLNNFHIQGGDKSEIHYGAFFNDILVGVMTFNRDRNMTKSIDGEFELSRFATNSQYIVSGLGSKFLKTFISEYNPTSIISFADRRWTVDPKDNLYTKLGFKLTGVVKPTYYYYNSKVDKYKRIHKFSLGKTNLRKKFPDLDFTKSEYELTKDLGYDRIWNCGLFKFTFDNSNNR